MVGSLDEQGLLTLGDAVASLEEAACAPGLDLDNGERRAALGDEVQLAVPRAPVALQDAVALGLEVAAG